MRADLGLRRDRRAVSDDPRATTCLRRGGCAANTAVMPTDSGTHESLGIQHCILHCRSLSKPGIYNERRYRSHSLIEMKFDRLKDWRRVATHNDRCPSAYFYAIALAATVIFWM